MSSSPTENTGLTTRTKTVNVSTTNGSEPRVIPNYGSLKAPKLFKVEKEKVRGRMADAMKIARSPDRWPPKMFLHEILHIVHDRDNDKWYFNSLHEMKDQKLTIRHTGDPVRLRHNELVTRLLRCDTSYQTTLLMFEDYLHGIHAPHLLTEQEAIVVRPTEEGFIAWFSEFFGQPTTKIATYTLTLDLSALRTAYATNRIFTGMPAPEDVPRLAPRMQRIALDDAPLTGRSMDSSNSDMYDDESLPSARSESGEDDRALTPPRERSFIEIHSVGSYRSAQNGITYARSATPQ
jgi:hypothetical protein